MSASFSDASSHALAPYGWDEQWAAAFEPHAAAGLVPGRVVCVYPNLCEVATPAGPVRADTALVMPPDPLRIVCTGDWAAVDPEGADPRYVRTLLPRRTAFVRSTSSRRSEGQVLAANIDHIVICVSLAGEIDLGRLERFLALAMAAAEGGAQPLVVLTKADLADDAEQIRADAEAAAPGVQVLVASSATGEGIDVLAAVLAGGTSVLVGQSGTGKSTLANTLLGEEVQRVNHTRDSDGKGRHTTVRRDLLALPHGGVLIDTPGLRGVGMWDAETGVQQVFSEIEELAARCRFHDCAHNAEPGCAVLAAVEDGALHARRLESYRKLLRESEWIASRTDARLRAERLRRWKQIQRSVRAGQIPRRR